MFKKNKFEMIFEFIFLFKLVEEIAIELLSIWGLLGKAGKVGDLSFIVVLSQNKTSRNRFGKYLKIKYL
jgi:hypothetical protein